MTLSDAIIAKTESEIDEIFAASTLKESEIIKEASLKRLEIISEHKKETDRICRETLESAKSVAILESHMILGHYRENLFRVFCDSLISLSCERAESSFAEFICSILIEGSHSLRSNIIDAYMPITYEKLFNNHEDSIKDKLNKNGISLRKNIFSLNSSGGAVVCSEDKKRLFTNTIERRIQKINDELREEFYEKLGTIK